jgi:hypothetical protein
MVAGGKVLIDFLHGLLPYPQWPWLTSNLAYSTARDDRPGEEQALCWEGKRRQSLFT